MAGLIVEIAVGIGVILVREGKVLLGKRRGAHGAGTWALPGGHLDEGETIDQCAIREVMEETGMQVTSIRHGCFNGNGFPERARYYITLFVEAGPDDFTGEPVNTEPHRNEGWDWFEWHAMPAPLFPPLQDLISQGYVPASIATSVKP
ncbi:MAG: NUDIX domain-containing protein [Granulosicoccus sp.]|nr:NUDIX domain-containing protein [Granulosicoccus sp.]